MKILCVLSKYAYGKPERGENYDYVHFLPAFARMGHEVGFFDSGSRNDHDDFSALNAALLVEVQRFRPDVIFCVLMHYEIWFETLDLIRANSPAVLVNWGTDDSWKFRQASRFFARHVDLHVTTSGAAAGGAKSFGLDNVMLSQWAASSGDLLEARPAADCRYDVTFIGNLYGYRGEWIAKLRDSGISVTCFGHGTEGGVVEARNIPGIYNTSRISLNFSGAGSGGVGPVNRQIKARTFEVPGAGGFLLTENAPGLQSYFTPGVEIGVFETPDDLIAKVKHYAAHPDERDRIARVGHVRTRNEHTYEKRFGEILARIWPALDARRSRPWTLRPADLDVAANAHRVSAVGRLLRAMMIAPFALVFGRARGARAARRLTFELSWRFRGEATYCARGLPGRLFYSES